MKNLFIFLWGLMISSGWWGFSIIRYHGIGEDVAYWFGPLFGLTLVSSIMALIWIVCMIVLVSKKCWD